MSAKIYFYSITTFFLAVLAAPLLASEEGVEDHIGEISPIDLLARYPEFAKEYQRYEPTDIQLENLKALEGKEVFALFGTWCHDSEREIPRLLKLIEKAEITLSRLTLYGVSRDKDDPAGIAKLNELQYTPTLIVRENGEEVTRIVERPRADLAADFALGILAN